MLGVITRLYAPIHGCEVRCCDVLVLEDCNQALIAREVEFGSCDGMLVEGAEVEG